MIWLYMSWLRNAKKSPSHSGGVFQRRPIFGQKSSLSCLALRQRSLMLQLNQESVSGCFSAFKCAAFSLVGDNTASLRAADASPKEKQRSFFLLLPPLCASSYSSCDLWACGLNNRDAAEVAVAAHLHNVFW